MIVLKFGGTSVGSVEALSRAIGIVSEVADRGAVVVVSALSGVTNDLVQAAADAAAGDWEAAQRTVAKVRTRHEEVANELVIQKSDFFESFNSQLGRQLDEILAVLRGLSLVGEVSPRARDKIVSLGETLSSVLFAYTVRTRRLRAVHVDSGEVIRTNEAFGNAEPIMEATARAAAEKIIPEVEKGRIPVMGGYYGRAMSGAITTLGRGGSDYSAAIVGAAIGAEEIQIWTDVDGMMTSDPRMIPGARLIEQLTYAEAAELAYFGAKVLHPRTIEPAVERDIPVRIRNTGNPSSPGTLISRDGDGTRCRPRAVAISSGMAIVTVSSPRMLGTHGILASVLDVFARVEASVDVIATSEVSISLTVDAHARLDEIEKGLAEFGRVDVESGYAAIAIVGREILGDPPTASRIFASLKDVPIAMMSLARSGLNLTVVVSEEDAEDAVRKIHHAAFES
ncbi:MAG: aspartate kinase [Acidobacteria bacterium]|nr:aspartate kinase [Acidobacteriota bacterium]